MAPPRATLASPQKSVSEILGKLEGLEEVVAAVRESVEEVQTQANTAHENHVGMYQQLQRSVDDIMQRDPGSGGRGVFSCTAGGCQRRECGLAERCCPSVLDSDRRTAGDVQSQTLRVAGGVGGGDCRDGPGDK